MKDIPHGIHGKPLILATNNIFANGKSVILSSNAKESDSSHKKVKTNYYYALGQNYWEWLARVK